ncbi:sigma 54-interacting transcriptional regulator [Caldimonas thermodepolymerans]|uniref:Sigma-54-dependent Fis family transcriptional regulator n=1 Tax=Caldimonas thermodepolymerans TaxID=215580 RepID=A0A2S5T0M0_9BURK|nr:sigma 54-interacting transcriptional regulator [Caldimonas thermodepolymerans]PPE68492.1 sigma-54-dependent Fis family transcriptional regulator [Caldimonas thermodepolymerans]QPC31466.1 sigma 54-interacting transcriptional regulator [Caldimonas thermodepolymerans]RDH99561.1 regulatory Fis family protein [Caldimonas thermodepolymerans]
MTVNLLLLEGATEFATRVRRCLDVADVQANVFTCCEEWQQFNDGHAQLDGAIVGTGFLENPRFRQADWDLVQGLPVLWIGSKPPALYWIGGKNPVVLHEDFTFTQLRSRLVELGILPRSHGMAPAARRAPTDEDDFSASILHRSPRVTQLIEDCRAYACVDSPVLLIGETGTGKELFARAVAQGHPRYGKGPFVPVNCGSIPETLFESLFFGHAKGSFTNASRAHKGHLVQAHGGVLFLDEIGDLPLQQQVKLLRALEDGVVWPVGATEPVQTDFRLVAATNRDLREMVREGRFRADLYYRIAVIEIAIPSLDTRGPDDKVLLFATFFQRTMQKVDPHAQVELPPWIVEQVAARRFPGNVRELMNLAQRTAALFARYRSFDRERFDGIFADSHELAFPRPAEAATPQPAWRMDQSQERLRIIDALRRHGGRREAAARALGISRKTLWEKMRKHELLAEPGTPVLGSPTPDTGPGEN